ncbi:endonuclease domain-containing protein [Streptomyces lancefieldiae]|uniref:endonuclease domain-containing protein n=1 Tax=Streptomyces lancefieldiae TaxID=3075520 RepID=UPI00374DFE1B
MHPVSRPTTRRCRPRHTGEHTGAPYHPRYRPRASAYRCDLCPDLAAFSDHCHAHGLICGPLCLSCNGSEGLLGPQPRWSPAPDVLP